MSSSLSDRLRQLAGDESDHTPLNDVPIPPRTDRPSTPPAPTSSIVADNIHNNTDNTPSTANNQSPRTRKSPKPTPHNHDQLKMTAVPILITIGVLLFIPFVWAIMLLSGIITNQRHDARSMAFIMLSAGPLAFILIAGAAFFYWQIKQNKK